MYRTMVKEVFWEFGSIIMQNLSDILPLFCIPTCPPHHVSETQEYICVIFNQSLISHGIFPDGCKSVRFTLIFKRSKQNDLNNYRLISVISVVANVFERTVYDQLYKRYYI